MKSLRSKLTVVLAFFALIAISFGFMLMPSIASAKTVDTSTGFYAHDGAEIRVEDDGTGIKWTATMTAATYKKLQDDAGANITEIGISIIPSAINGVASAESYRKYYPYGGEENPTLPKYAEDEGVPTLNGSATFTYSWAVFYDQLVEELGAEDLNDAYALNLEVKPYVVINGETVFGESYNTSRSMRSIATYWILSGKYDNDEVRLAKLKSFLPYELVPADTEYRAEGCYYSNHDGVGAITIADDIKSVMSGAKVYYGAKDITELYDADAGVVNLTGVETQITTDGLTNDYLTIVDTTDGTVYKQYFVGVTLAIDELSDFTNYFKLTNNEFATSGGINATIPEGEAEWDGYYIMLADIEGAGLAYNATISHNVGCFNKLDAAKIDAALANGTTNGIMTNGKPIKGLTGTFDGNGHQIKNLRTTKGGLFGMVLGGTVKNLFINKTGYVSDSTMAFIIAGGSTIENVKVINDRSNVYSNYTPLAQQIGNATIKNVMLEATSANVDWGYAQDYAGYPGSFGTITADTKVENAIVISKIEGSGTITTTSWTPNTDAEYVDGDLNETAGLSIIQGLRRYSSVEAFNSNKDKIDFSTWDPSAWVILDNTPIFRATLDDAEYGAFVDGNAVSESPVELIEGNSATVTLKYGIDAISATPVLSIVSGEEFVSVDGDVITALAEGDAVVKVTYGKYEWNINVSVMAPVAEVIDIQLEYQFSAYDGLFFDGENQVPFSTIMSQLTELGNATAFLDSNNNVLTYNEETGAITGLDLGKQSTWKEDSITVVGDNASYRLLFRAADLIIDEATDFAYFTLDGTFSATSNSISYSADDFVWDGYHVMVKDIDAKAYTHNSAVDADPATASMAAVAENKYGLSGVFDGQGHSVSKMFIRAATALNSLGLFGFINGGTVKNVTFDNLYSGKGSAYKPSGTSNYSGEVSSRLFATYLVNGGSIVDCDIGVYTTQAYASYVILSGADDSSSITRTMFNLETLAVGSGDYKLFNNLNAQLNEVYVVAQMALTLGGRNTNGTKTTIPAEGETGVSTTTVWRGASVDAATVNDVTKTYTQYMYDQTNKVEISLAEYTVATSGGKTYSSSNPFSTNVLSGVKRYSTFGDMENNWDEFVEGDARRNDFSNWSSSIWTISSTGIPTMHAITK